MAAECRVDVGSEVCGVAAIGRCSVCSRPFCMTHQAQDHRTTYTNWCSACRTDDIEREQLARRRASWTQDWVREHAAQWLRDHGVLAEPYGSFSEAVIRERSFWRQAQYGQRFHQQGEGWLIGDFDWEWEWESGGGAGKGIRKFPTMLLAGKGQGA